MSNDIFMPPYDTEEAISFLKAMHPNGPWHLVAVVPDGKPIARTFDMHETEELKAFIEEHQGEANLYFHVNELRAGVRDAKARKTDVEKVRYLHVDIDDPSEEALERLRNFTPRPTTIVFSGGGVQGFWRIK